MAFGGSQKGNLSKNLYSSTYTDGESNGGHQDDNELLSSSYIKNQEKLVNSMKQNIDDILYGSVGERTLNDYVERNIADRNTDDINQSSDSLSSSASITDSDLTSTDSDDSLALSESESITDVTPLNSPYCDSPLPQSRHMECKSEDKIMTDTCRNDSVGESCHRPEMNVLMKVIEKLELETNHSSECGFRDNTIRRRTASFSNEEVKRIEQENQRLFKRVMSQQNRIRSIYSTSGKNISCRNQGLVKSDGDITGIPKKPVSGKVLKQADKSQTRRKQKCLSHPSTFIYPCNHLMDKSSLTDGLCCEGNEKKNHPKSPGMKIACSQRLESNCEEVTANSVEMK